MTLVVCCGPAVSVSGQSTPNWQRYNQATVGIDLQASSSLSFSPRSNLWVTHVGQGVISKLDGYDANSYSAPVDGDFRVYESGTGQLWALHPTGLQSSDGTSWNRYVIGKIRREMELLAVRAVRQIPLLPAEHNNVLVLLSDQLFKYDAVQDQSITLLEKTGPNVGSFIDLIPASDGGIWITAETGIVRVPLPLRKINSNSTNLSYSVPASLDVRQLRDPFEYQGGLAMIGIEMESSKKVLVRFVKGNWTKMGLPELPNKNLRRCWITADGRYWGLTVKELYQWTESRPEPVRAVIEPDQFSDVAMDPAGSFFISGPGGVWRYAPAAWRPPVELTGNSYPVSSFAETPKNGLWFTDGVQLIQVHDGEWKHHEMDDWTRAGERPATQLGPLPSGNIVLVNGDRVAVYDVARQAVRHIDTEGRTGLKLLGGLEFPLVFTDSTKELIGFEETGWKPLGIGTPGDAIGEWTTFIRASNGDLWLGGTQGAARHSDGAWSTYPNADGALAIAEFSGAAIWIGGDSRVQYFSAQGFSELDSFRHDRNGRPILDRVNTLGAGLEGEKWIAAANGLWKELGSTWLPFGGDDGLPRNLLTFHETTKGARWVGSEQGVYKFFPETDREPPRTSLVETPGSPKVSRLDMISFSFSGQDKWHAGRDERLFYSWRFDDEEWSNFSEEQKKVSRNGSSFSEGEHLFEVRAMDIYQNIDPSPVSARFDIIVPWFEDTRLRGITVLAALAVLVFAGLAVNRHLRLQRSYTEIERIVEERTHQLKLANQELAHSEKMRSLGTLAAGVAHDFNSILSIIRGSVQIIEANPDNPDKIQTRVNRIKSMVEQGSTLVKSMLGFSRADDTGLAMNDVDDVVEGAVELLGDRLPEELSITVDASPDLPPVRGNRELLQQIIVNLVLNAVDAMDGKGTLVLRCHRALQLPEHWVLPPASAANYVTVTVEDNGCGITQDNLSRIFEPFFTTKAFSTRHGTGLGLSMVYEFCKELGYGLNVRSELRRGTSFNIVIPILEDG